MVFGMRSILLAVAMIFAADAFGAVNANGSTLDPATGAALPAGVKYISPGRTSSSTRLRWSAGTTNETGGIGGQTATTPVTPVISAPTIFSTHISTYVPAGKVRRVNLRQPTSW